MSIILAIHWFGFGVCFGVYLSIMSYNSESTTSALLGNMQACHEQISLLLVNGRAYKTAQALKSKYKLLCL